MECSNKIQQAQSDCDALIDEATTKAEIIIAKATEESQKLQEAASTAGHQEGYNAGFAIGVEAGEEQARQAMAAERSHAAQQAMQLLKAAQQDGQEMILAAQQQIVELSVAVARKILLREIDENPFVVLPIVQGALEKVRDQQVVTVRVHSRDCDLIMQSRHDLQVLIGREQPILVQSDDSVPQGSCLIDSTSGTVDARIDTQLESIRKVLQEVVS